MAVKSKPRRHIDEADVAVSTLVVEAVSAETGTPVDELPCLHDVIDTDALAALFAARDTAGHVRFRYAGHDVTVHADRTVEVSA